MSTSPSEPDWVTPEIAIKHNRDQVGFTGENHALLFPDRLESALVRPVNLFAYEGEEDVVALAVSAMFAVAMAHAFEQGNKRTGFAAGISFLNMNGYDVSEDFDRLEYAFLFEKVVNRDAKEETYLDAIQRYIVELKS